MGKAIINKVEASLVLNKSADFSSPYHIRYDMVGVGSPGGSLLDLA